MYMPNETNKTLNDGKTSVNLLENLAKADENVNVGRVAPIEDTYSNLRKTLKNGKY